MSNDFVVKLDKLFDGLLNDINKAGVTNELKIDLFKEGVRWAAIKNKLDLTEPPPATGRLATIKGNLRRG